MGLIKKLRQMQPPRRDLEPEPFQPSDGNVHGLGLTSTRPNIFGGLDEYRDGILVATSRPNIFGGLDKSWVGLQSENGGSTVLTQAAEAVDELVGAVAGGDDSDSTQ
jgi:hypothetical protein